MAVDRTDILEPEILEHVAAVVYRVLDKPLCGAYRALQLISHHRDR